MPELDPHELRVLREWITSDLIANAIGGDESPTPSEEDEDAMNRVIDKFYATAYPER